MAERIATIYGGGADIATGATRTRVPRGTALISWSGLLNGDTGKGVLASSLSDKMIQFRGTFGVGGTIVFEGSNDSTDGTNGNWVGLVDPQGNAISKTAAMVEEVLENPLWVRPRVTAGDGTTSLIAELTASTTRG